MTTLDEKIKRPPRPVFIVDEKIFLNCHRFSLPTIYFRPSEFSSEGQYVVTLTAKQLKKLHAWLGKYIEYMERK